LGQPNSYMSPYSAPITSYPQSSTQAARATLFQTMVAQNISANDSGNTFHIVGFKWWEYYDNRGETANWGLSTRRDNQYDGVASRIVVATDAWGFPDGGEK